MGIEGVPCLYGMTYYVASVDATQENIHPASIDTSRQH
jgi:hypothetical protein